MASDQLFSIRLANKHDVPAINVILTHYALNTVMTFATEAQPDSSIADKLHDVVLENHLPFLVATPPDLSTDVIGICYVSPYRADRPAYYHTGELSLFVHHEHHGNGIGSALLKEVLQATKGTKIKELIAIMAVDSDGKGKGLALRDWYVSWGFKEAGRLEKIGFKFERW